MDIAIVSQVERPALSRTDYEVRVAHQGATPPRHQLRNDIAGQLKTKKELVVIRTVEADFGNASAIVSASAYKDQKALDAFEQEHIKKRHGAEPEAPAEEKAEEATAEEAPAEETPKEDDA